VSKDILIGIDAGTSMIKSVAFDTQGNQLALCSLPNEYKTLEGGGVEQDMLQTWNKTTETLLELSTSIPQLRERVVALAVTGQGDGTWLIDRSGVPVHDAWLWLDARSTAQAMAIENSQQYDTVFNETGTGVNVCQMRTQMRWMQENSPHLLANADTSFHCKDYLYYCLTSVRATDPSEAVFTFGDYHKREYSPAVIEALGLSAHAHLLPPIVDGVKTADKLTADAAEKTGLPVGLPVCLGYVDVICTALGGGLLDESVSAGMTILGTTGIHMRHCRDAHSVSLGTDKTGYTMAFPDGGFAQLQSNMAATMNIDWMLDLARDVMQTHGMTKSRNDLLLSTDDQVLASTPAKAIYHPYISTAGERGPFINPAARANFFGLDQSTGFYDLMRSVFEGLAFAAKDCYVSMGALPDEIRVSGGAAKSSAMLTILSAVLDRPVRVVEIGEAGATGAVMISAIQQGFYASLAACARDWVSPHFGQAIQPDPALVKTYDSVFPHYVSIREELNRHWIDLSATKSGE